MFARHRSSRSAVRRRPACRRRARAAAAAHDTVACLPCTAAPAVKNVSRSMSAATRPRGSRLRANRASVSGRGNRTERRHRPYRPRVPARTRHEAPGAEVTSRAGGSGARAGRARSGQALSGRGCPDGSKRAGRARAGWTGASGMECARRSADPPRLDGGRPRCTASVRGIRHPSTKGEGRAGRRARAGPRRAAAGREFRNCRFGVSGLLKTWPGPNPGWSPALFRAGPGSGRGGASWPG